MDILIPDTRVGETLTPRLVSLRLISVGLASMPISRSICRTFSLLLVFILGMTRLSF
jgi:hypothetical protein